MKRILCVMLTAVLVLALCVTACAETTPAEVYTHPLNVYSFNVPNGWIAIDGESAKALIALGLDVVEIRDLPFVDMSGEALEEGTVVMLYETEKTDGVHRNYINFGYMDLGQGVPLDNILSQGENFAAYLQTIYEGYHTTVPIAKASFGALEAAVLGGEYMLDNQKFAIFQAIFTVGTNLFTVTLSTPAEIIAEYESVLAGVVSSLTIPHTTIGTMTAVNADGGGAQADAAVLKRGTELMEAQDFGGALAHFDAAIAERGDVAEYHAQRGAALLWLDRYQEMADSYSAAIALDADYWEYYNERGVAYFYMGKWDEALADFQKAVDLDDPGEDAYINLAYLRRELGDAEESVITCALGLTDYPESDDLWGILGDAQFDLGHYAEALAAYDKLLATGDYAAEDITNYAAAMELAGKPPALLTYSLDDESIPSVDSVVGFREIPNTESGFSKGSPFVKVHYRSASVLADLQAYVTALIDGGWAAIELQGDASGGMILLSTESAHGGKLLMVTAEYTADAYSVLMQRADGTLRRYTDGDGNKLGEILHAAARAATAAVPDDVIGVWYLNSVEMMGMSMHPSELDLEMTMEFFADNTVSLYSSTYGDTKGTWAIQDGRIIVSPENGTDVVFMLMEGNLCDDQIGMVFGKEKEEVGSN